jgi:hypothetical protein
VRLEFGRGGVITVNAGEEHGWTSVAQGRRKGKTGEGWWGSGRLYRASTAQLMGERGREREGGHGRSSRQRAAPACSTGWRGSRSGSTARRGTARGGQRKRRGGGRKDRATRGTGSGWCRAAGAREAAGGGGQARAQRSRGDRGLGEDDGGPGCKKQTKQGPYCNL